MSAAAARRAAPREPPAPRIGALARAQARRAAKRQPLEHRILLTATLCLLAFGAVMVYSASSATTLLQGQGNGSGYLIKFVLYGALGLVLMRVLARDGVAKVQSITAPLLVDLVRARARGAHPARRRERQRRAPLDRPGLVPVPALGADEARARAVRRHAAGQAPAARARPARAGQPAAAGRRRGLPAGRHPARPRHGDGDRVHDRRAADRRRDPAAQAGDHRRRGARRWCSCTRSCSRTRARG